MSFIGNALGAVSNFTSGVFSTAGNTIGSEVGSILTPITTGINAPTASAVAQAQGNVKSIPLDQQVSGDQLASALAQAQTQQGQLQGNQSAQQGLASAIGAQGGIGAQGQALASQQGLAAALGGGAGNLGQAYNQQQALAQALGGAGGIQNQSNILAQQQALSNQFGNVAAGQGPNPAQAMLAQSTGQNVAQQQALMAGQRGAGSNVGLLARQAAQQGGNIQQQAAGQAATLQANQSLGAMQAQAGQQQAMANLAGQQVNQQLGNQSQVANIAGAQVGAAQNAQAQLANQAAGLTNQQMIAQQNSNQLGLNQAQLSQSLYGTQLGASQNQNAQALSQQQDINKVNADLAKAGIQGQSDLNKGLLSGMGSAAAAMAAEGGEIVNPQMSQKANLKENYGPKSFMASHLLGYAHGGDVKKVDALVSPGEVILSPEKAKAAKAGKGDPLDGKVVPGKPKVAGSSNSYANDTVPMKLPVGSIVQPRSVTQSDDPKASAKKFVETLKSKRKGKK